MNYQELHRIFVNIYAILSTVTILAMGHLEALRLGQSMEQMSDMKVDDRKSDFLSRRPTYSDITLSNFRPFLGDIRSTFEIIRHSSLEQESKKLCRFPTSVVTVCCHTIRIGYGFGVRFDAEITSLDYLKFD